jgi:site-specific recombinase XerD
MCIGAGIKLATLFAEMEDFRKQMLREGKSENTIYNYIIDLNQFFSWLDADVEEPLPLVEISKKHITGFIDYLLTNPLVKRKDSKTGKVEMKVMETTARNRKLSSIKNFFKFLHEEQIISVDPAHTIRSAKIPKRVPKPINEKDLSKLTKAISENAYERAMIEILYGSGVRREELVSIEVDNIDLDERWLKVIGKGNKERGVPISDEAIPYIKQLIESQDSHWLFPSPHPDYIGHHISIRYVNKIVTKWAKQARLNPSKITPHKFRHSFATDLMNGGADMAVVSEFLGHESPATTKMYASVSKQRSREIYQNAHPRAKAR